MSNRDDLQTARAEIQNALGVMNNSTSNLRQALQLIDKLLDSYQLAEQRREDKHIPIHERVELPKHTIARNLGELVSAKQLGMIRALCRELKIYPDTECNSKMGCKTDELSKTGASAFIRHLQEIELRRSS